MQIEITKVLNDFSSIDLEEMKEVSLLKRTDTKFIIPRNKLIDAIYDLKDHYKVLEIQGKRILDYSNLYFDTSDKRFYHDHHNGRINRFKVRIRNYVDSDLFFLEVKQKNGKGRTIKSRVRIEGFEKKLSQSSVDYIKKTTSKSDELSPTLWNNFSRITLVNKNLQERVTIDLELTFKSGEFNKSYKNLVIVEVKQDKFDRTSVVFKRLRSLGFYPYNISKYCIGMVSSNGSLKQNMFKQKLIKIDKVTAA